MGNLSWNKWLKLLFLLIIIVLIFGCAATEPTPNVAKEMWVGEMSGMVTGTLNLMSWQTHGEGDVHSVTSMLDLEFDSTTGGYGNGTLTGRLTGRIKDGVLDATISGHAESQDGSAMVRGKFVGTVSETQGFGTWKIFASQENIHFSGEWSIEKK